VWNRLIFPDGSSLSIQGMPGEDKAGNAGFDADVNNHYAKVFGSALLMATFSAGISLSQKQSTNAYGTLSNAQTVTQAVGQQLGQTGEAYITKGMNIQPTLTRAPGYRFNIVATKDIVFPGAYVPHPTRAQ
jgi:type IV secretion system protein TrbI